MKVVCHFLKQREGTWTFVPTLGVLYKQAGHLTKLRLPSDHHFKKSGCPQEDEAAHASWHRPKYPTTPGQGLHLHEGTLEFSTERPLWKLPEDGLKLAALTAQGRGIATAALLAL